MKLFLFCAAIAFLLVPAHAATVNLQFQLSSPILSGPPGSTVEWFAGLRDPIDLGDGLSLLFTGSSFNVPCQGCGPAPAALGSYSDVVGAGFLVLAPPVNCCADPQQLAGEPIGTFAISPTAPFGPINGFLEIDYALFSVDPNDPNFNPDVDTVDPDVRSFTAVTVSVVPEPGSFWLAGISAGCLILASACKRWLLRYRGTTLIATGLNTRS